MTAVGILGTFVGIVIALVDFNTQQVEKSIPTLLEGLKLAFVTSVTGLAAAIITEFVERVFPSKYAKVGDPVAEIIQKNSENLNDLLARSIKTNEHMANEIGQMYKTVSFEMTQTRSFLQEEFGGIRSDLDNALRKLAEGASEEIIKSLENVILRFNENLTAQFGENFKKLNEACFQLVQWQQDFKTTVEKSSASIQLSSQAMQSTNQHFENLHEKMAEFGSVLAQMSSAILSMNQSSQTILEALSVQHGLVETFKNKLQETSLKVKDLTEQIEHGHLNWLNASENREKLQEEAFKRTEERNRELDTHQRNLFNENIKMNETVVQNNQKAIEDLRKASAEYENRLNKSLKGLEDTLISLTNDFGSTYKTFLETTKGLIGNP